MKLHAIVPVKHLARAKSRLAGALSPTERRGLVLDMLGCVLDALACSVASRVWVVSGDPAVLALAAGRGAAPLLEAAPDLNAALEQARSAARIAGAEAVLALPADVPLVTPGDAAVLAALLVGGADVALAPDLGGHGTNALALRASAPLAFAFGIESAARHLHAAAQLGLTSRVYHSPTLALDVDDPTSLARYRSLTPRRAACAAG